MRSHSESKLLAISFALAAAGILACAGALLDAFIPKGSVFGFLAWMAVLGIIVIGTVVGYSWICDKCDRLFNARPDRLPDDSEPQDKDEDIVNPRVAASRQSTEPRAVGNAWPASDAARPSSGSYVVTLRGSVSRKNATQATAARTWHGQ